MQRSGVIARLARKNAETHLLSSRMICTSLCGIEQSDVHGFLHGYHSAHSAFSLFVPHGCLSWQPNPKNRHTESVYNFVRTVCQAPHQFSVVLLCVGPHLSWASRPNELGYGSKVGTKSASMQAKNVSLRFVQNNVIAIWAHVEATI